MLGRGITYQLTDTPKLAWRMKNGSAPGNPTSKPRGEPSRTRGTKHSSQEAMALFPVHFSPFPLLVSVVLVNLKKKSPSRAAVEFDQPVQS